MKSVQAVSLMMTSAAVQSFKINLHSPSEKILLSKKNDTEGKI